MDVSANHVNTTTSDTTTQINLLDQYINALITNLDRTNLAKEVNLIFDSGAVNGLLGIGAALYIHNLEKHKLMKVNKLSGCSIGSLIAVWYICGCPDTIYHYMDLLFSYYKEHQNFYIFESIVRDVIGKLFIHDDMTALNGILYINYYDTLNHQQVVISRYNDRAHLITCILRSSHVPFITNESQTREGRYIDGIAPYLFDDDISKNLFIKLISLTKPLEALNLKNEQNIYTRLLRGVAGTNEFFVNGNIELCCYVNRKVKLHFFIRERFVLFIIFVMNLIIYITNKMSPALRECLISRVIVRMARWIWYYLIRNWS